MPNKKKRTAQKKSARKPARRKVKTIKAASKSAARKKKFSPKRKRITNTGVVEATVPLRSVERRHRRDGQAGDLQGLSDRETVSTESVDELLEEGNAFEAEAVESVESAPDADQAEVKTHEVPEDDVPQEYLDSDRDKTK